MSESANTPPEALLAQLRQRDAELAILSSVGEALVRQLDFQGIIDVVGAKVLEILNSHVVDIALYDAATDTLHHRYNIERGVRTYFEPRPLANELHRAHIIASREPLVFGTFADEQAWFRARGGEVQLLTGENPESWLGVPIVLGDRALGVVSVQQLGEKHRFDDADIRLLSTLASNMGVALENARLFDETKRLLDETRERNAELAIINTVQAALASKLDMQTIYAVVGEKVGEIFKAHTTYIANYDPQTNLVAFTYYAEEGRQLSLEPREHGFGVTSHVINTRQPLLLGTSQETLRIVPSTYFFASPGAEEDLNQSYLGVPLIIGEQVTGVVSVQSHQEHAYDDDDVRLLTTLANSLSVALENARLFDETKRLLDETRQRNAELAIINSVGDALARQLDFQGIIDAVGDKILEIFQTDIVSISLYDPAANTINHRYVIERGERIYTPESQPLANELHRAYVIAARQPLMFGSLEESQVWFKGRGGEFRALAGELPESWLGVPIILGDQAMGVVSVQQLREKHRFGEADIRLLSTLASNMGVALENARLFHETKRLLDESRQQAAELETVNRVSLAISSELEIDALIQLVGEQMRETFHADIAYVALYNERTSLIEFPYVVGDELLPMTLGEGLTGQVVRSGEPLLVNKRLDEWHREMQIEQVGIPALSYLGVPISVNRKAVGVLSVQSRTEEGRFGEKDVRLLDTIAANVGIALANARLFTEAQKARAAAEAADQSKSDFLSSVSHELRTPLTSVLGFARIIQKQLTTRIFPHVARDQNGVERAISGIMEDLGIILAEGERLTTLINNVLDLAKIEAGRIEWHMGAVDMNRVIERAAAATTALFEQKALQMIVELDPTIALVNADQDRMIQVVINLLSNAVKFTDAGAIICRVRQQGNEIVVSVADSGIGIALEDIPKVFEKFRQVGDTLTSKPTGTGLGLPICKEIVEYHGGRLWAESKVGVGSTFYFALPVLASEAETAPIPLKLAALIEQLKARIADVDLRPADGKIKLLVVDDDANVRTFLRKTLIEEGYDVREAANGTEAILLAHEEQPALVILDVLMPGISGFDVVAALKNQPETRALPIIILSIVEDRERGYQLGVDRYLVKPIDPANLLGEIANLIPADTLSHSILIADANADTLRQLSDLLSVQHQYTVREASDAKTMLERALADQPSLIVANAQLADKTVLARLRRETAAKTIWLYQ